jgi:hypothetical protein
MATHHSIVSPTPFPSVARVNTNLYGIQVLTEHFTEIKTIADELVGHTDHREFVKDARRRCAAIASLAWEEARTPELTRSKIVGMTTRRTVQGDF